MDGVARHVRPDLTHRKPSDNLTEDERRKVPTRNPAIFGISRVLNDMADHSRIWPQNVPGAFYVDQGCIDCNLCSEIAPDNFAVENDAGHDFVFKQPEGEQEMDLSLEAMECCPVEAIGNDG